MTVLVVARHGNTFEAGEPLRRVGARTDLPLTEKGREQAKAVGRWLKDRRLVPDVAYSSRLRRTKETAAIAVREAGLPQPVYALDIFDEIDYGPDENRTEDEVIARIGAQALKDWDERGAVPPGWSADPRKIAADWIAFAGQVREHADGGGETVLVVTSNGIARFVPHITGDFDSFRAAHGMKIATGALCVFRFENGRWALERWNERP